MSDQYRLYGAPGWGSTLVEGALAWCGAPYEFVNVKGFDEPGEAQERLAAINPALQVPALQLPGGEVMTESAAMVLYLAETFPDAALAPPPGADERPRFLRRLIWFAAAIYPTFTIADYPARLSPSDAETVEQRALERREDLWRQFEAEFGDGPLVLGATPSALDIYVAVMTNWIPGREWFAAHCPKLSDCALKAEALPKLAPVIARNFP